jgi:excisionase family DNA binding protein
VLGPQPLEDPLRRMSLLARPLLVIFQNSRREAAQLLSISVRGIDYLVATKGLPCRKIGSRVLIPVVDLRKYARGDHPERIVA